VSRRFIENWNRYRVRGTNLDSNRTNRDYLATVVPRSRRRRRRGGEETKRPKTRGRGWLAERQAGSEKTQKEQHVFPTARDFVNRDCRARERARHARVILVRARVKLFRHAARARARERERARERFSRKIRTGERNDHLTPAPVGATPRCRDVTFAERSNGNDRFPSRDVEHSR